MDDVIAVAGASALFVGLLATAEGLSRRWKVSPEVSRKSAHLSCGVAAAGLPLVMSFPAIAVLALLFVPFMVVSRRIELFPAVHSVERTTLGEMYFPLGVLAAAVAVPHAGPFAYGMLVLGISDAVAGVAGERWGRRAYRIATTWKTYVGSGSFFVSTLILTVAALTVVTGWSAATVLLAMAIAAALTLLEGTMGGGADNLVLPVAAALLLHLV